MTRFLAAWLGDAVRVFCMLTGALLLMQVPAFTHEYASALLQVAQDARRDVDLRIGNARRYYRLDAAPDDAAAIEALRPLEPSNAATLSLSVARAAMFRDTAARIEGAAPLVRPVVAAWDITTSPNADKLAVLRTGLETYAPQVMLRLDAAIYGAIGLLIGGLIGQAITAIGRMIVPARRAVR
jgi:hypothetical protein